MCREQRRFVGPWWPRSMLLVFLFRHVLMPGHAIHLAIGIVHLGLYCWGHLLPLCRVVSVFKRFLFDELALKKSSRHFYSKRTPPCSMLSALDCTASILFQCWVVFQKQ